MIRYTHSVHVSMRSKWKSNLQIKIEIDDSSIVWEWKIICDTLCRNADWMLAKCYSKNKMKNEWLKINDWRMK